MIWIICSVFITTDAWYNSSLINKGYSINHYWNATYRVIFYGLLLLLFRPTLLQCAMFLIGIFFAHWLLFNIILNLFRGLAWDYLGKGSLLDRLESNAQIFVIWCKLVMAIGFIYAYFHTDLL